MTPVVAAKAQVVEVNFSQQSRRLIERMTKALESKNGITLDPNTDYRVHDTIVELGYSSDEAKEIMQALKKAGLLVLENPNGITQE